MSQALRKLTGGVSRSKCVLIFINQIREKIGVMFGSPETTPGGRALKFYSSARVDVRRIGPVKDGEEVTGSRIKAKVVKNKVAPPFRVCEFDMMYTNGISREGDVLDLAIVDKIVEKSGSWFNYGDLRLGQGRENAKQFLRDSRGDHHPDHRQPHDPRPGLLDEWDGRRRSGSRLTPDRCLQAFPPEGEATGGPQRTRRNAESRIGRLAATRGSASGGLDPPYHYRIVKEHAGAALADGARREVYDI
jgi:hypothetical protein